jgi:hypothetical protein
MEVSRPPLVASTPSRGKEEQQDCPCTLASPTINQSSGFDVYVYTAVHIEQLNYIFHLPPKSFVLLSRDPSGPGGLRLSLVKHNPPEIPFDDEGKAYPVLNVGPPCRVPSPSRHTLLFPA